MSASYLALTAANRQSAAEAVCILCYVSDRRLVHPSRRILSRRYSLTPEAKPISQTLDFPSRMFATPPGHNRQTGIHLLFANASAAVVCGISGLNGLVRQFGPLRTSRPPIPACFAWKPTPTPLSNRF